MLTRKIPLISETFLSDEVPAAANLVPAILAVGGNAVGKLTLSLVSPESSNLDVFLYRGNVISSLIVYLFFSHGPRLWFNVKNVPMYVLDVDIVSVADLNLLAVFLN